MRIASPADLVDKISFKQGTYDVCAVPSDGTPLRSLLTLRFAHDDEEATRHVPEIQFPADWERPQDRNLVCCALVRAGVRHPGVEDEDLRHLHQEATRTRHIELFADLNAISTGFLSYLVRSLGHRVARVVVSSSCIDVLHEYQGRIDRRDARGGELLRRAEMTRVLRSLEEMRRHVPVHIHQLPPGATRYFQRNSAGPQRPTQLSDAKPEGPEEDSLLDEERTFISEDRQMMAAFWEYMSKDNPRVPVVLATSDFALAHVCAAERVPFIYARSPQMVWSSATIDVSSLWLDPFAPALRFCTSQQILWELCVVFGHLRVEPKGSTDPSMCREVKYDRRQHLPGKPEEIQLLDAERGPVPKADPGAPKESRKKAESKKSTAVEVVPAPAVLTKTVHIPMLTILSILPFEKDKSVPLARSEAKDKKADVEQIGTITGLFTVSRTHVRAGPDHGELLRALEGRDYLSVNAIFRKVPAYDDALRAAEASGTFPKGPSAMIGWAIVLGAAYKKKGSVLYGLTSVSRDAFAAAVRNAHAELAASGAAAQLPGILDRVCTELRISPIRFEALLDACLGKDGLADYEAQRATVDVDLPAHQVVVSPSMAEVGHFLRQVNPGRGVLLGGSLVSSLVKRGEST